MTRANVQLLLLVPLMVVLFTAPSIAARSHHIRQPVQPAVNQKHTYISSFLSSRRGGILCVGEISELLSQHEGRHPCAYDHEGGYRAVGCGYNLDDDVDEREWELLEALADYDEVYNGTSCLNNVQISGLLILDAARALDRAAENVEGLKDLCCPIRAVFADIQHSSGAAKNFPKEDLHRVIERVASEDYEVAANELRKTKWCSQTWNKKRCVHDLDLFERGCYHSRF
ncbi:hypothetical protein R1sor_006768 [Riccia sorocarpa]|uniref:Uncharacterized protein n=1 Tax=Riccia sorocarpa TaxID=122646 RepID=A0ABD3HRZ4_9MARC